MVKASSAPTVGGIGISLKEEIGLLGLLLEREEEGDDEDEDVDRVVEAGTCLESSVCCVWVINGDEFRGGLLEVFTDELVVV